MKYHISNKNLSKVTIDGNDSVSLFVDGGLKSLTSKYDREAEQKRFLDKFDVTCIKQVFVIFGIGNGEWLKSETMTELSKKNKIIIVEPYCEVFDYFKENFIDSANENMFVYVGDDYDGISSSLSEAEARPNNVVVDFYGNYINCMPDIYRELLKVIRNYTLTGLTPLATMKRFNELFTSNMIKNFFGGNEFISINTYKDIFGHIPALIISAGPSLEKQLDKVKSFNGLIFSGGRTMKTLVELGIKPDFFVSIDPHKNVYHLIEDVLDEEIPLITGIASNHLIVKEYAGPKILINDFMMSNDNCILGNELDRINGGGSVANAAFSVCQYMGCDPIVFIGQDLALTDGQHHAGSTVNVKVDKENKVDLINNTLTVDGYYGGNVHTRYDFIGFLQWFENIIENSDNKVFNCTEGGAKIKGCEHIPFEQYLNSDYNVTNSKEAILDGLEISKVIITDDKSNEVNQMVIEMMDILYKAKRHALKLKASYSQSNRKQRDIDSALKQLKIADEAILSLSSHSNLLSYVIKDAYNDFQSSMINRRQKHDKNQDQVVEATEKFYYTLYEKVLFFKGELEKVLED